MEKREKESNSREKEAGKHVIAATLPEQDKPQSNGTPTNSSGKHQMMRALSKRCLSLTNTTPTNDDDVERSVNEVRDAET